MTNAEFPQCPHLFFEIRNVQKIRHVPEVFQRQSFGGRFVLLEDFTRIFSHLKKDYDK